MRRLLHAAAAALALTTAWAVANAGCSSDLTDTSPGHDQCDAQGQCLAGFACDPATNTCLPPGTFPDASADAPSADAPAPVADAPADAPADDGGPLDGCAPGSDACAVTCTGGKEACGDACVDEQTDPLNCGACAKACAGPVSGATTGAPTCTSGDCGVTCDTATHTECTPGDGGTACVATATDPLFCGNCTTQCTGGQACVNGACTTGTACAPGLMLCGTTCVNVQSDPFNCSACNDSCPALFSSNNDCQAGGCRAACGTGFTSCSVTSGLTTATACVDLQTDPTHCGKCATACGTGQICAAGLCTPYVLAGGCWECADVHSLPTCCTVAGQPVCTNAAVCPQ